MCGRKAAIYYLPHKFCVWKIRNTDRQEQKNPDKFWGFSVAAYLPYSLKKEFDII